MTAPEAKHLPSCPDPKCPYAKTCRIQTFSGGSSENVGMMRCDKMPPVPERSAIDRALDGPMPDLSRLDEKDQFVQSFSLTMLIHDAFVQQKENLLNLLGQWLMGAIPAIINLQRSWPFLARTWAGIDLCENILGKYADFVLAVLLVGISSALYSILFIRILEMRDMKYLILLFVLLGFSFMLQETLMIGWDHFLRMYGLD
ncbi:hypothetical protein KBA41_01820 [Candidatus Ozemobacteraceae bacterium]|nr:hypothetical protein [Candidatus Ozemobacteraceae bacterium]